MGTYLVRGGKRIEGEFAVRGSKNAALPILAACVLAADEVVLENRAEYVERGYNKKVSSQSIGGVSSTVR